MVTVINNFVVKHTEDVLSIEYIINKTVLPRIEKGIDAVEALDLPPSIIVTIEMGDKYGSIELSTNSKDEAANIAIREAFHAAFSAD